MPDIIHEDEERAAQNAAKLQTLATLSPEELKAKLATLPRVAAKALQALLSEV